MAPKKIPRVDALERNGIVDLVCARLVSDSCSLCQCVSVHVEQKDMPEERMICVSCWVLRPAKLKPWIVEPGSWLVFTGGVMSTIPKYWCYALKKKKSYIILYTSVVELLADRERTAFQQSRLRTPALSFQRTGWYFCHTWHFSHRGSLHVWADFSDLMGSYCWMSSAQLEALLNGVGLCVQRISGSVRKTVRKQDMLKNRVKASTSLMGWTAH